MIIGVLQAELRIDWARSLKDKRTVIRSLKDRLHRSHQVSVAEVGAQDIQNTLLIGVSMAGSATGPVLATLDAIERKLGTHEEARLIACQRQLMHGWAGEIVGDAFTTIESEDLAEELLGHAEVTHMANKADGEDAA